MKKKKRKKRKKPTPKTPTQNKTHSQAVTGKLSLGYQNPAVVKRPILMYVCRDSAVGNESVVREIKWSGAVRKATAV